MLQHTHLACWKENVLQAMGSQLSKLATVTQKRNTKPSQQARPEVQSPADQELY